MAQVIPILDETWIICGGRDFTDAETFERAMEDIIGVRGGLPGKLVHGASRGADALADEWARQFALAVSPEPADWSSLGARAGPIRNQRMIDNHSPAFVVAFPGGHGTADMVRRARKAGIVVCEVKA